MTSPEDLDALDPDYGPDGLLRPEVTAERVAELIAGRMMTIDPDPVRRWKALGIVREVHLPHAQALAIGQLVAEHGSYAAAARELGVSRVYVHRIAQEGHRAAGTPGADAEQADR